MLRKEGGGVESRKKACSTKQGNDCMAQPVQREREEQVYLPKNDFHLQKQKASKPWNSGYGNLLKNPCLPPSKLPCCQCWFKNLPYFLSPVSCALPLAKSSGQR